MTDIEKLAAALEKVEPGLGRIVYNEIAERIAWCINDTSITASVMAGLIEGTHVVVPVEPTVDMCMVHAQQSKSWDDWTIYDLWKAMLKAAQEDL